MRLKLIILLAFLSYSATTVLCDHPLDPLSGLEIQETSDIIKRNSPSIPWMFIWITLKEPEKSSLIYYFLTDIDPPVGSIPRKSFSVILDPNTKDTFEVVINLETKQVESWTEIPSDSETTFVADEFAYVADFILDDPVVLERLSRYGPLFLNKSNVVADVWKYGHMDDRPDFEGKRVASVYFHGKLYENDNFYARPMGFIAIVDTLKRELLEIQELPIQTGFDTTDRSGDTVPMDDGNYDPMFSRWSYRWDVSPITISQPNNEPSFTVVDNVVRWQKFKMRLGRSSREGLVLHNINYNDKGNVRPLIYRASLAEIFVPYGDPRPPYNRKMAIDVGEYGMGFLASEMRSPEACRGSVYFLDAVNNDMGGFPNTITNAICIYEEDAGILWRKQDPETRRVATARSQRLVLTFIATVANYDYQFKWIFYQDASIRVEVVLTGIVSQNLIGSNGTPGGHGTVVMPHLNAIYHQHFFVCRFDTEFDGTENTVSTVDIYPDEAEGGTPTNPYGNGFHVVETVLETPAQARTKTSPTTSRSWRIIGRPDNLNPISGGPKGWKLHTEVTAPLMFKQNSVLRPKTAFTDYDVWVTPYRENQLFPAGFYLNNSGLPEWVANEPDASIRNTDVVLWHVFGITHAPRVEDLPVMPVETIGFWLKPANFFTENPGIDVLPFTRDEARRKKKQEL